MVAAACTGPVVIRESRPRCRPYPDTSAEEEATVVLEVSHGALLLLDGRPYHLPRTASEQLECNPNVLALPPGWHTLHLSFQITGFSPMVAVSYGALACGFSAIAGHSYRLELSSFKCQVLDQTAGDEVVARATGCHPASAFLACPQDQRQRADRAYFELVRAFGSCGDEVALREFEKMRSQGRGAQTADEWELQDCNPFFDLR
jgi:hypothetical protein